jgi:WD40 repeat protein/serine/threonine protein kinase/tetratricopeptide (TPR) repeat protein
MATQPSEQSVFLHAIELDSPAERASYLDEACAGDTTLRADVEALLAAHDRLGAPLPETADAPNSSAETVEYQPPQKGVLVAGRYKLLLSIGEGGMGEVWMAEQTHPVQRKVALKLIRTGMNSEQVVVRFEIERQALALMDHPNIAKVLDAGTTDENRPFFVMELVEGVPITDFCDRNRLSVRERLELFVQVCQAVQHAHQKGVIHRDLKPSNVLVALYDGKPVPKVIDFGIAKATGSKLTDRTLFTGFGAVVGTLEYMSPEQAEMNQLDIDTRSDIYSLGVLMYELLTGTTPLQRKRVKAVVLLEALRLIREEEPQRPSTRLSTTAELPAIAANRGLEPRRLSGLVRGELDWIVMKCLEKDRNRRYESANGLARDVERYLADEPVQACPPSARYRVRKFLRRNKGPVLAASLLFLTFCAGLAGTTWKWLDADYQKGQARSAAADAQQKTKDEQAARKALQKTLYEQAIALAFHEWQHGNPGRATQLLDECRPEDRGWEWHYIYRLCHSDRLTLAAHGDPLHTVAYSPDGRLIASGSGWYEKQKPGEVIVWDAETGQEVFTLKGHTRLVRSVVFSSNGKLLASCGLDSAVCVWDVTTRQQLARFPGRGGWMTGVAFSPDSQLIVVAEGAALRVWDVAKRQEIYSQSVAAGTKAVAFSPDGQQIVCGCRNSHHVMLWKLGSSSMRILGTHTAELESVAFSPDGRRVVSAGWDTKIKIWNLETNNPPVTIDRHTDVVSHVSFSPDGKFVASASWDGTVGLWDSNRGTEVRTFRGHTGLVYSVAFNPDGERLATVGADHQVKVWDMMTQQEGRRVRLAGAHPYGLAFRADGKLLAVADGSIYLGPNKSVTILDSWTGLPLQTLVGHSGRVTGVAFHPSGPLVASASSDGTVKLWDTSTGRVLYTFKGHEGEVTGVAFSVDGHRIASSGIDRTVRVWDLDTRQECRVLRGHTDTVTGVAFAPDGRLASSSADRTVRIWDATDDTRFLVLNGHTDVVTGVAFSPDGQRLTSGSADQTLRVWEADGTPVFVLRGHTEGVWSLAYNPTGDRLVSASRDDNTVRLWDLNTGRQLLSLRQNQVISVAFSPKGQCFASGAAHNEIIQFWDASPPQSDEPGRSAEWFKYYAERKQYDKADAALARTSKLLPGDPSPWLSAAHFYSKLGLRERALAQFEQAIQLYPADVRTWRARAQAYFTSGQWDKAIIDYAKVVELAPDDVVSWNQRGTAHDRLNQRDPAIAAYRKAIQHDPNNLEAHINLGYSLLYKGSADEAIAEGRRAVEIAPRDGRARLVLGEVLNWKGRADEAIAEYRKAIEVEPRLATAYINLADALRKKGDVDAALAVLDEASRRVSSDRRIPGARGECYLAQKKWRAAINDFTVSISLYPSDVMQWRNRAMACLAVKDRDGYRQTCVGMLIVFAKLDNSYSTYWAAWTAALAPDALTDFGPLLKLQERWAAKYPAAWSYQFAYSALLCRAGQYEKAIERLTALSKYDPQGGNGYQWLFLALAHHHLGHAEEARQSLNKAVGWIESATKGQIPSTFVRTPLVWPDNLALELLRAEAEELILGKPKPEAKKEEKK